jgi:hypothetical protein
MFAGVLPQELIDAGITELNSLGETSIFLRTCLDTLLPEATAHLAEHFGDITEFNHHHEQPSCAFFKGKRTRGWTIRKHVNCRHGVLGVSRSQRVSVSRRSL